MLSGKIPCVYFKIESWCYDILEFLSDADIIEVVKLRGLIVNFLPDAIDAPNLLFNTLISCYCLSISDCFMSSIFNSSLMILFKPYLGFNSLPNFPIGLGISSEAI